MAELVGADTGQGALHLVGDELHGHAQFPLLQALTHADNGAQAHLQGGVDFLVDGHIRLIVVLTALGVPDDDILYAQLLEHLGRHLAGICAIGLIVAVLGADGHPAVFEKPGGGRNVHIGNTEHHVAPLAFGQDGLELFGKGPGLREGLVHLPVSGDDGLPVSSVHG